MENFVKQSLLYDFYGDLLTEHQKAVYEAHVLEDLSLAETADAFHISRQGAHDIIKRVNSSLEEYEDKLGLVQRFLGIKEKVSDIENCCSLDEAKAAARQISELL